MEMKCVRKIVPTGLVLMALLMGDHPFAQPSNSAWAQSASPSSPPAVNTSAAPSPKSSVSATAPANASDPSSNPTSDKINASGGSANDGNFPLLLLMGVLGLWNVVLSYLTWRNFSESSKTNHKIFKKIKELDAKDNAIDQRINRRSNAIDELKGQLYSYKKTLEVVQAQAQSKSSRDDHYGIESRTKPDNYINNQPFVSQGYDNKPRSSHYDQSAPAVGEPWDSIVQNYNASPQMLENYIIERVSESEESVDSRRGNSNAAVFLKAANNYSYWIFTGEDRNYWLTPKSDLKITGMGFDTFQALFECPEYLQGSKIQVIRPAKVSQNGRSGGWDLLEKGQVLFTT
jgi:hypothetical protein